MATTTTITRDDWLKALAEVSGHDGTDDQDAVTHDEFADMLGVPVSTAHSQLQRLVASGRAVRTSKRGRTRYGRNIRFVAYRLT